MNAPGKGSLWRHHGGKYYRVLMVTNASPTNPNFVTTVVYESVESGDYYSRPLSDWHEKMEEVA